MRHKVDNYFLNGSYYPIKERCGGCRRMTVQFSGELCGLCKKTKSKNVRIGLMLFVAGLLFLIGSAALSAFSVWLSINR